MIIEVGTILGKDLSKLVNSQIVDKLAMMQNSPIGQWSSVLKALKPAASSTWYGSILGGLLFRTSHK